MGTEKFLKLCTTYGKFLTSTIGLLREENIISYESLCLTLEPIIVKRVKQEGFKFEEEEAPLFLKEQYPELFLSSEAPERLKDYFYKGLNFSLLSTYAKDWLSFFSQHRKFMFDVILIAQSDAQLDKQIRGCIDVAEKFMDVRKLLPDRGWYCPPIFKRSGKVYGVRGQAGAIGQKLFRVRKRWAQSYNTFELFGVSPLDGFPEPVPVVLDLTQHIKPCYRWKRPLNLRYARRGPGRIAG